MRRIVIAAVLATGLVLGGASGAAAEPEDGEFVIEHFDADLTVDADGAVAVSERLDVDFAEVEHRGIFRVIPLRYVLPHDYLGPGVPPDREPADFERVIQIEDLTVAATAPDDVVIEDDGDDLVVRIGDPDVTVTGRHTYELDYTLRGAGVPMDDRTEFVLDVTGHGWSVPILRADATVTPPAVLAADCAAGPEGATGGCEVAVVDDTVTAFAEDLDPGEGLTVAVDAPGDAVASGPPLLEERWRLSRALTGSPAAWPLAALTAALGLGGLVLLARRGRDEHARSGGVTGGPLFDPPDGLRPAEVAVVERQRIEPRDLSATLLDLASRGHLRIDERNVGGDDEPDWQLRRTGEGDDADLRRYERYLLGALFSDGEQVTVSAISDDFADRYRRFRDLVHLDAVARGWFRDHPRTVRNRWLGIGAGAVVLTVALLVAALALTEVAVAVVPLVLAAAGVVVLANWMPSRTAEGVRLAEETSAFRAFLKDSTQQAAFDDDPAGAFGRYLPYAVTFGAVSALTARLEDRAIDSATVMPAYYVPVAGSHGGPSSLASSLGGFAEQAGKGLATAPSSGTGAGAGGSGGGVSAGGGVGGGGGGGW